MSYLRFSPEEYKAICHLCRPLNLGRFRPHALRRLLVRSLADRLPALAERLDQFRGREMRILFDHLQGQRTLHRRHGLTAEELRLLAEAYRRFLFHTRFSRPLRRALVAHFQEADPALAAKLEQLSHRQFEALGEQVQERGRREA